jgi:hypothetical protein
MQEGPPEEAKPGFRAAWIGRRSHDVGSPVDGVKAYPGPVFARGLTRQ